MDGLAWAAVPGINVVSDLRSMDVALGGQGAPIVPVGERLLLPGYALCLNGGGIATVSRHGADAAAEAAGAAGGCVAFDVCPANRVLNSLAALEGRAFDEGGALAGSGRVDAGLLAQLDELPYYNMTYPKSLASEFGTETVLPLVQAAMDKGLRAEDALRTYVEHITRQVGRAVRMLQAGAGSGAGGPVLGAGRGAHQNIVFLP